MERTISDLIDELITVNIKCFLKQDEETSAQAHGDYELAGKLGEQVIFLNRRRGVLRQAIDEYFDDKNSFHLKMYGGDK